MNYILILFFLLPPLFFQAQTSKDYVIDRDSNLIYGNIKAVQHSLHDAHISFESTLNTRKHYTPAQLLEWSKDGQVYCSKPYPINKRKQVLTFMKRLSPALTVTIYEYTKANRRAKSELFLERAGKLTKVRFGMFRKQMQQYFADQPAIVQLIKDREVQKKHLLVLVTEYNELIQEQQNPPKDRSDLISKKNQGLKSPIKQFWNFNDMLLSTDEAAKKYMAAIEQATRNIVNQKLREIEINFGVGYSFFEQQQYDAAIPYLKQARKAIEQEQINSSKLPIISAILGSIYFSKKKYISAVNYNTNALLLWKSNNSLPNSSLLYNCYLNQGKLLQHLPPSPNNVLWYEEVLSSSWEEDLKAQLLSPIRHANFPEKSIDFTLALLFLKKAATIIPQLPLSLQASKTIEIKAAMGALYFEAGEYSLAQLYYEQALNTIKQAFPDYHPQATEFQRIISEIYLANELYSEALKYINQAQHSQVGDEIKIDRSLLDNINKIPFPFELLNSITTKGIILYEKNKHNPSEIELKKVLAHYAIATELLYQLRRTHRNDGASFQLGNITHKLSQQAVLICNTLYNTTQKEEYLDQAFLYAELSKSAVLFETLHNLNSMEVAGIPKHERVLENGLKVQISYLKGELYYEMQQKEKANPKRIQALEEKITKTAKEYEILLKKFERNYPAYFTLKYNNQQVHLSDLQKTLAPDQVFLEYVVTDSFVYVLAIGAQAIKSQLTKLSRPLPYTIKKLQHALKDNKADLYAIHGNILYQKTIGPLANFIKNKRLIIAPDAELNYIPFGVLPTNKPELKSKGALIYKQTHFLIEDHPICYNYSASLYLLSKQLQSKQATQKIATWAPNFDTMKDIIKEKGLGDTLPPLPGAQLEAQHIAELFGSMAYIGANASELKFKQQAQQYSVLHIATHGVLNDEDPLFSSLILKNQAQEDGILHAFELYNMNLNADLAVLSACNSGMGRLTKGEGVVSIARGFSYAGVPNIVMSKWAVSDWSTELLMKQFYKNLKQGMPKDEALQKAKISFLNNHRDKAKLLAPFYWGSFVLSGNTSTIEALQEDSISSITYLIVSLIIIGFIFIFFKIKKQP